MATMAIDRAQGEGATAGVPTTSGSIVVPLDGSRFALAALGPALALAARLDAELILVQAVAPAAVPGVEPQLAMQLGETDARIDLERAAAGVRERGLRVREVLVAGPAAEPVAPAQAILTAAREAGAALIAMATHGRTGVGRAVLGSVADAVVRQAPIPVLLVRPAPAAGAGKEAAAPEPWPELARAPGSAGTAPLRLALALDGSPEAEAALEPAAALARGLGAGLDLLRVVPEETLLLGLGYGTNPTVRNASVYLAGVAERLQASLAAPADVVTSVRISPRQRVADTLIHEATSAGACLLVLATHARWGLSRLILGSVASTVLARSPLPVLLVRAQRAARAGSGA